MRVLLVGSGGREHALAWRLSQSPSLQKLLCAPGNPGIAQVCDTVPVGDDPRELVQLAQREQVDLVVVGPEAPLVRGLSDALQDARILVFGPSAGAAALEGSKAYAKEVMRAAQVPTAAFETFGSVEKAKAYALRQERVVVKADGLAAGKGVVVAFSSQEAAAAVETVASLGSSASRLVLEELLEGEEISVIALCDGERYALLPPAQDHKRVGEGDSGPNTGGMGAYAPAPFLTGARLEQVGESVVAPVLREMRHRGIPFRGALYAGLMLTARGPKVLEFNVRFGDPETQVLVMQLDEDLLPLLLDCARGQLAKRTIKARPGASVGVVLAAPGYPSAPRLGDPISISPVSIPQVQLFHAGTRRVQGQLVTSGGRVMTACAQGQDLAEARARAYQAIAGISFTGMHYRRDIGAKGLRA